MNKIQNLGMISVAIMATAFGVFNAFRGIASGNMVSTIAFSLIAIVGVAWIGATIKEMKGEQE